MKRIIIEQSDDEFYTSHSALALAGLCLGKSDYEAISGMRDDDYFKHSLGITNIPSAEHYASVLIRKLTPISTSPTPVRWPC